MNKILAAAVFSYSSHRLKYNQLIVKRFCNDILLSAPDELWIKIIIFTLQNCGRNFSFYLGV